MSLSEQTQPLPEDPPADVPLGAGINFEAPNSPLAPWYCRISHVVAAVLLGAVFVLLSHFPIWHTDVWAHLRFGEEIVRQRALPQHEDFPESYADKEAPYIHFQWLAQAGAYLLFELGRSLAPADAEHQLGGGAVFLAAAHAFILTLRLGVLLVAFRRRTASMPFALVGVVLVFAMTFFNHLWILRPQILGELGFALLLLALSRPVLSNRAVVLLPLLFVLWANSHGSFLMGFVLLGAALAGQTVSVIADCRLQIVDWSFKSAICNLQSAIRGDAQVRRLALVIALSLAGAALLNPHGPYLLLKIVELSRHPNIAFMEEWKPLPVKGLAGWIVLATVALLVPLLRWSPRRFTATEALLLLGFGVMTLAQARGLIWWIMIFPWVTLPHLQATCQRFLPRFLEETDRLSFRKTIFAGLAAGALFLWSMPAMWLVWGDAPLGSKRVNVLTPLEASHYLRAEFAADPQLRRSVFTDETTGDFLIWDLRLDPPVRLFAYTHVHLFTREHWLECMTVKSGDRRWQAILDAHGVQFLVVDRNLHENLVRQVLAAPDRWQVVSERPVFVARRKADAAPP